MRCALGRRLTGPNAVCVEAAVRVWVILNAISLPTTRTLRNSRDANAYGYGISLMDLFTVSSPRPLESSTPHGELKGMQDGGR